jgi:NAD(P)-dependent dehydrogenase (short-subunit alcohol dehydrogenase family)
MEKRKVAIITGAGRGIGAATAVELARRGYLLTLIDLQTPDVTAITSQAGCEKADVLSLAGDLTDLAFAQSTVEATWKRWGRIDALVNNASWREVVSMRHITVESWERTLRVGLTTPAFMARWAARYMEEQKSGVIVNISSVMAERAGGFSPAYIACKGAINSLTYELASLYGPSGIRVVGVSPGAIDTEMSRELTQPENTGVDPVKAYADDMIMLGRWGTPQEIAKAIAWLVSDEAAYITATTLSIDGGWMHQHFPNSLRRKQFSQL